MDPNAALVAALEALCNVINGERPHALSLQDREDAAEALEHLAEWLRADGFGPMISRTPFATSTAAYYVRVR